MLFIKKENLLFPAGLEPATFRALGGRDNHYTTETILTSESIYWQDYCFSLTYLLKVVDLRNDMCSFTFII